MKAIRSGRGIFNRNIIRVAVAFTLLALGIPASSSEVNPCGDSKQQDSMKTLLIHTARSVLNAIKNRDGSSLIGYLSPRGAGFGVDQPMITVDDIKRQLNSKRGVYCLLFSTACIARNDSEVRFQSDSVLSQWKISYAEWLNLNSPYPIEGELLDDVGNLCGGLIAVRGRHKTAMAPNVLELEFIFENGAWRLANTPYVLGD